MPECRRREPGAAQSILGHVRALLEVAFPEHGRRRGKSVSWVMLGREHRVDFVSAAEPQAGCVRSNECPATSRLYVEVGRCDLLPFKFPVKDTWRVTKPQPQACPAGIFKVGCHTLFNGPELEAKARNSPA